MFWHVHSLLADQDKQTSCFYAVYKPTGFSGEANTYLAGPKGSCEFVSGWGAGCLRRGSNATLPAKTRRHSSWTHILTSLLQTICPADSSCATPPLQPPEIFFLGGENPWGSTLPSPITALGTPSIKPLGKMLNAGFPLSWFLPLHQPLSAAQGFWQRKQDQMLPLISSPKTEGWGCSQLFCHNREEERKGSTGINNSGVKL